MAAGFFREIEPELEQSLSIPRIHNIRSRVGELTKSPQLKEEVLPMPRIVDSLIAEIENEAATTERVLERVPGDKFEWQPHPTSMSLAKLSFHVASVPGQIAKLLDRTTMDAGDLSPEEVAGPDQLLPRLDESVAAAKNVLNGFDDAALMVPWVLTRDGKELMSLPRAALIRAIMMNHWYHHRGQLSVYLRMLDVPIPSIYGPSADENPFA